MKRKMLLGIATIGILVTLALARVPQDDALDPLKVAADTHKLALDNKFVRVLEVRLPPGKVEPLHRHPHGMSIYFTDWEATVTDQGKEARVTPRKAGTFAWSEAIVHTVKNSGKTEGHVLRVELKF